MKALACAAAPSSSHTSATTGRVNRRGNRVARSGASDASAPASFPLSFPAGGVWLDPVHLSRDVVYGQSFVLSRPRLGGPGLILAPSPPRLARVKNNAQQGGGHAHASPSSSLAVRAPAAAGVATTARHPRARTPPPRPLLPGCAGPIEVTDYRVVGGDGGEEEEEETVVVWALPAPADAGPAAPLSSTSAAAAPSAPFSPIRIDIHAAAASLTPHPRRTAQLAFTCALCGARTQVAVNPAAWKGGTVFARCGGAEGAAVADAALEGIPPPEGGPCGVIHLLKDELKLFHELGGDVFPRGGGRGRRARFNE